MLTTEAHWLVKFASKIIPGSVIKLLRFFSLFEGHVNLQLGFWARCGTNINHTVLQFLCTRMNTEFCSWENPLKLWHVLTMQDILFLVSSVTQSLVIFSLNSKKKGNWFLQYLKVFEHLLQVALLTFWLLHPPPSYSDLETISPLWNVCSTVGLLPCGPLNHSAGDISPAGQLPITESGVLSSGSVIPFRPQSFVRHSLREVHIQIVPHSASGDCLTQCLCRYIKSQTVA